MRAPPRRRLHAAAASLGLALAALTAGAQPEPPTRPRPHLLGRDRRAPDGRVAPVRPPHPHERSEDGGANPSSSHAHPAGSDYPLRPRAERRREKRAALKERWGDGVLSKPAVRGELRAHAWRLARLARLERLARDAGKTAAVERVQRLRTRENARHQRRMEALSAQGGVE
ncbi:MAG: hypothetical protein IT376_18265 [Polyangiaceae bacterium]|nr:hypothetical protein [Polyangiaceae bacterium]